MKSTLTEFNFEKFATTELDEDTLAPVRANATWLLPQTMAFLGGPAFTLVRNEDDKFSMEKTIRKWISDVESGLILLEGTPISPRWLRGMISVLNRTPRGEILGSKMIQSKPEFSRWSSAVPLILSAFKVFRSIPYAAWDYDREYTKYFMDKYWCDIMQYYQTGLSYTKEELVEILEETNNGKPLTSRITIPRCSNSDFNKLPRYLKTMLCQVWVWHPSIRHPLAITNLNDLDIPAEPLFDSQILKTDDIWNEIHA